MTFRRARGVLYLTVDILLLVLCVLHLPSLMERARAPFRAESSEHRVLIHDILDQSAAPQLRPGDQILAWNDLPIPLPPQSNSSPNQTPSDRRSSSVLPREGRSSSRPSD